MHAGHASTQEIYALVIQVIPVYIEYLFLFRDDPMILYSGDTLSRGRHLGAPDISRLHVFCPPHQR